jgi:hypothetical protein
MKIAMFGLAALIAAGAAGTCLADDLKALQADPKFTETTLGFDVKGRYANFTFTVTGPAGFSTQEFSGGSAPSLDIRKFGDLPDGVYIYQLSAATDEKVRTFTPPDNNGRDGSPPPTVLQGAALSGSFLLTKGVISTREASQPRQPRKQNN